MSILLPVIIFLAWLAFSFAPIPAKAIEDLEKKVPRERKQGTSIFPGFPIFPAIAWILAWAIDAIIEGWGTYIFLSIHALLLIASIVVIIRDGYRFHRLQKAEPLESH